MQIYQLKYDMKLKCNWVNNLQVYLSSDVNKDKSNVDQTEFIKTDKNIYKLSKYPDAAVYIISDEHMKIKQEMWELHATNSTGKTVKTSEKHFDSFEDTCIRASDLSKNTWGLYYFPVKIS